MKNSFLLTLLGLLVAGCGRQESRTSQAPSPFDQPDVVAVVGGETINRADIAAAQVRRNIPAESALADLIERRALVQEARTTGLDHDPEFVAAVETMLAGRMREKKRGTTEPEITAAEIGNRYKAEPRKYTVPARIRAAMIFVEAPPTLTKEARAERRAAIEAAHAKATAAPKEFASLAAEFSWDQETRYRGGDLGYIVEGTGVENLDPAVISATFALRHPGELTGILTTPRGFYITALTERTERAQRPLAEVGAVIRATLRRERQQQFEKDFTAALHAAHPVEIRPDRLPAVPVSESPLQPPASPAIGQR